MRVGRGEGEFAEYKELNSWLSAHSAQVVLCPSNPCFPPLLRLLLSATSLLTNNSLYQACLLLSCQSQPGAGGLLLA